jgi:molybdate transport system permease protein
VAIRPSRAPIFLVALAAAGASFVAIPLLGLLARAPWSRAVEELSSSSARTAFLLSLEVSIGASLLSLMFGFPLAWVLARTEFPGKRVVRALVVLPLILPPVVAGVALLTALGRRGLAGRLLEPLGISLPFTTGGAIVAAFFVSVPLLILAAESGLRSMDVRMEDAAATMGASRWYALRRVTLPAIRPQLLAGLTLAWARALGEFGATITFAGNLRGRTQTLPLAVFEELQTDPDGAVLLSMGLIALSLGTLIALRDRFLSR